jgi:hypothetical protein
MDFSNHKFRCSSLGHVMTGTKDKKDPLGETCKAHLIDVYVSQKYNRQTEIINKYVEKGLKVEEDSITLYSRVNRTLYFKNEERLLNDYIQGCPDLFLSATGSVKKADLVIDIKSSWDIFTFFRTRAKSINKMYYWQGQGYMALTGAKIFKLAYCLVNTPEIMISDEVRKMMWKMAVISDDDPLFQEAKFNLEKNMRYDDIPIEDRVIEIIIQRDDNAIEQCYDKIKLCRKFLNEIENKSKNILRLSA